MNVGWINVSSTNSSKNAFIICPLVCFVGSNSTCFSSANFLASSSVSISPIKDNEFWIIISNAVFITINPIIIVPIISTYSSAGYLVANCNKIVIIITPTLE